MNGARMRRVHQAGLLGRIDILCHLASFRDCLAMNTKSSICIISIAYNHLHDFRNDRGEEEETRS